MTEKFHNLAYPDEIYYLPGMGGRLDAGLGEVLLRRGFAVTGRETVGAFKKMRFGDQADWSCPAYVPVSQLIYAAFRSNAKGLFPPNDECRRLGL